jgi:formylglycine-generating enzyme required for sulfatase activity
MSGNVWEWTRSLWGKDFKTSAHGYPYDPKDPARENLEAPDDILRVLRGGSFSLDANILRAANRNWNLPQFRGASVGFRVVSSRRS